MTVKILDLMGKVLFDGGDKSTADTMQDAVNSGANLSGAYLSGAYLSGANLSGANLQGVIGLIAKRFCPLMFLFDQPGAIRAYKLVGADLGSPMAALNGYPKITYAMGESYSVVNANTDPAELYGAGLNVCTLDWAAKEWKTGYRILVVEFTAADIACIPWGSDGKFRLHRLKVVGEKDVKELGL